MGSTASLGTLDWARAGDGRLSAREQVREAATAAGVLLGTVPERVRRLLGLPNPATIELAVDEISIPDSVVAGEAEELCRESSSVMLVNHCLRTFAWASILGRRDRLRPDPELLYVAAMLHDLALTDRFRDYAPMPCFGARAGIIAADWTRERGWDERRSATVADAISLHLNAKVPAAHGPEAQLLQAGAGLDVIGLRHGDIHPATIRAVLARYPREQLKRDGIGLFEAESHPGTRAHFLTRRLMFGTLVRLAPFSE